MKKTNSRKLRVALVATVAAIAVLLVGAFALFSDYESGITNGRVGTVDVTLEGLTLTEYSNINPGDNDLSTSAGQRDGTPHDLVFTVGNAGNKSIVTRNKIYITVTDTAGDIADPSPFFLTDGTNVYMPELIKDASDNVIGLAYTIEGKSFDGTGAAAETEVSGTNHINGNNTNTYTYKFGMLRGTDNTYQDYAIQIDVVVEAMQYRNTVDGDWDVVATKSISIGSGAGVTTVDVVPASNEAADGTPIV